MLHPKDGNLLQIDLLHMIFMRISAISDINKSKDVQ